MKTETFAKGNLLANSIYFYGTNSRANTEKPRSVEIMQKKKKQKKKQKKITENIRLNRKKGKEKKRKWQKPKLKSWKFMAKNI